MKMSTIILSKIVASNSKNVVLADTQLVDSILESLTYWNSTQTLFMVVSTMWSDIENETKSDVDFSTVYNVDTTSDPKRS